MLDYGIFYEFISKEDLDNKVNNYISLEDVKKDIDYAMIISTNSGLWRYHIGDIVSFTSTNPYRIIIKGRTKNCINTFGEELMVYNTDVAIFEACKRTNSKITDYTVAPIYMSDNSGRHEWAIEFEKQPEELQNFIEIVDKKLKSINSDYEAKRFKNLILDKPKITNIKNGIFYNWLKQKNKLGGQNKIERLKEGRDFINELKNTKLKSFETEKKNELDNFFNDLNKILNTYMKTNNISIIVEKKSIIIIVMNSGDKIKSAVIDKKTSIILNITYIF